MFQQIVNNIAAFKHYRNDQYGIIQRYLNEGTNWHEHLENTKNYILNSLPNKHLKSIAILGSGWLLDVPVDAILKKTDKLILFDICHPKQILNKYKNNKQIVFIKTDLTNNLIKYAKKSKSFNEFLQIFETTKPIDFLNNYSYVVSLNLLNQLDILLCDYLKKKFIVKDEELIGIRKKIQALHLKSLPLTKSCLITDYLEINYTNTINDNNKKTKNLIYADFNNTSNKQEWLWIFDTRKTYLHKLNTTFKVLAVNI